MSAAPPPPDRADDLPALSIRRPWLVVVLNLLIVIAGLGALRGVELRELPNVDRPVVAVRADFPGAAPETLDAEVTRVLEGAASRVPGVVQVRSGSEEGNLRVILEFSPDVDLVDAANDVRDAISRVESQLPAGVENLTIVKADADAEPVMQLAVSSARLSVDQLTRAVDEQLEPALVAVPGVADVTSFGGRETVMRVRLDPARLAAQGVAVDEVVAALRSARADVPAGSLQGGQLQVLVRANASLTEPAQLGALQLREGVFLRDLADIVLSPADATAFVRLDGRNVINVGVVRQAQSNSVAISEGVRRVVDDINARGDALQVRVVSDEAVFIDGALREVVGSLLLAAVIVVAVVGLFLGRWRPTLVPAVAIPVSLVGTLAAIWLLGFSLNLLTLLALVLASGLVVDDAIVVLENIQRRRAMGLGPRAAAVLGTREVFFAIMATTATLVAVFVPISFLPSTTGRLFTEFGWVMAIAVMLSSFVALSLGPMLAARIPPDGAPGRLQRGLGRIGGPVARGYARALQWALGHGAAVLALCLAAGAVALWLHQRLPTELAPAEDRGVLRIRLDGPDGAALAYADRQLDLALPLLQPLVDEGLVTQVFTITGRWDPHRAEIVAPLADWADRELTQQQIAARLQPLLDRLPGARVRVQGGGSSLGGGGPSDGSVRMAITGDTHEAIAERAFAFAAAVEREIPALQDVRVEWQVSQPQLGLEVDRERAAALGVPVEGLSAALRALVQGHEVDELSRGDRAVPVFVESVRRDATDPADLLMFQVRAGDGRLVPLAQFVRFEESAIAAELNRFGQRRAVEIDAAVAPGVPLQEVVDPLRALAARELPAEMGLLFRGDAATLEESARDVQLTFAIALLVVFLVLVAQFESVTSALVVLATVPFGLAAAVVSMTLGGVSLNLYSRIGLLLLVGVMAKNSILMVEFADQLRDAGRSVRDAAFEAATTRLRPIMMTMASTVLGALPLLLSSGPGAEARRSIGAVIFGGLSLAMLFTLFLTPVLYLGIARWSAPRADQGARLAAEMRAAEGRE